MAGTTRINTALKTSHLVHKLRITHMQIMRNVHKVTSANLNYTFVNWKCNAWILIKICINAKQCNCSYSIC